MIRLLSTSSALLVMAAAPVFAELTPVQVWDALMQNYREMGYTITEGSREEAGDTLTVTDTLMSLDAGMPPPPDAAEGDQTGKLVVTLPRAVLTRTGDGNVRTVFEGDITGQVDGHDPDGAAITPMTLSVAMPGNEMVTSGDPGAMQHVLTYPEITAQLNFHDPRGAEVPVVVTMADTTGTYNTSGDQAAGSRTDYDMQTARMTVNVDADIPESEDQPAGSFKADFALTDLDIKGLMTMPAGDHNLGEALNAALRAGADFSGTFGFGGYEGTVEFAGQGEDGTDNTGNATMSGGSGELSVAMSASGVSYKGSSESGTFAVTSNTMPFPMSYTIGQQSFDLLFPVMQSDEAQPFAFKYGLSDLALGDEIWSAFDQTAQLPRDPANLTIDIDGDLLVTRDMFDPEFAQRMVAASTPAEGATELTAEQLAEMEQLQAEAMPFQPARIALNRIALDMLGASADLSGELAAVDGNLEQPVGQISGNFTGINVLIDRLAGIGLIPQEQVAGARMMLMVFAKPVAGQDDTLETHIEFREDGSIFANGQQMR